MASSARIDELRKKFDENPRRYFAPLANEYRKSGDLEQAIFICQEFLPQQPGHMSGHIVYGQTLFELGRLDEAQAVFETALSLDPENLIALRHLGDIARQGKDLTAARIWYQRVLEADPRNEEIGQLMISLLASPEPEPEPAAFESLPLSREPLRAEAPPAPTEEATEQSREAAFEPTFEKAIDRSLIVEGPLETDEASAPVGDGEQDFLEFEPFNGGTFQTPVPSVTPEPMAHPATDIADTADMSGMAATPAEPGFDLGAEDAPFEADPFAIASPPPEPVIELATDLRLGTLRVSP